MVNIIVTRNENTPIYGQGLYNVTIPDTTAPGTIIETVQASDEDRVSNKPHLTLDILTCFLSILISFRFSDEDRVSNKPHLTLDILTCFLSILISFRFSDEDRVSNKPHLTLDILTCFLSILISFRFSDEDRVSNKPHLTLDILMCFLSTHWAISRSSQCSTTGVTKAVVCVILSVGWCI